MPHALEQRQHRHIDLTVPDGVCECHFADLAGKVCPFCGPIPKCGSESMGSDVFAHPANRHQEYHIGERFFLGPPRKNKRAAYLRGDKRSFQRPSKKAWAGR